MGHCCEATAGESRGVGHSDGRVVWYQQWGWRGPAPHLQAWLGMRVKTKNSSLGLPGSDHLGVGSQAGIQLEENSLTQDHSLTPSCVPVWCVQVLKL